MCYVNSIQHTTCAILTYNVDLHTVHKHNNYRSDAIKTKKVTVPFFIKKYSIIDEMLLGLCAAQCGKHIVTIYNLLSGVKPKPLR